MCKLYIRIRAIFTASLGGVLFGYDMGVIAGALPPLAEYFGLTPSQEERVVSLLYFGGVWGAATGGALCDGIGRKFAILFTDVMFGLGAFLLYTAETIRCVMIGRFVVGWAVAVSGIADVAYLHEISSVWGQGEGAEEDDRARIEDGALEEHLHAVPNLCVLATPREDREGNKGDVEGRVEEDRVVEEHIDAAQSLPGLATPDSKSSNGGDGVRAEEDKAAEDNFEAPSPLCRLGTHSRHKEGENNAEGRGSVVSFNEAGISLGFLLSYGIAYVFEYQSQNDDDTWRLMFLFGGILATAQFLGMLFMPESPIWLDGKGRTQDAISARNTLRGTSSTPSTDPSLQHEHEHQSEGIDSGASHLVVSFPPPQQHTTDTLSIEYTAFAIEDQVHTSSHRSRPRQSVICVASAPSRVIAGVTSLAPYKQQFAIAFFLAAAQQFCGHPNVLAYSDELFSVLVTRNDDDDDEAVELAVGVGLAKFITTCIVILFVDKGGRRPWLLTGMLGILLSLSFLLIAFIGHSGGGIGQKPDTLEQLSPSLWRKFLGVIGIYGTAIGYAASFGPLTWLITSELFPPSIRGRALGFTTIVSYLSAGLVTRSFLSLTQAVGLAACFGLYWVVSLLSIVLAWLGVPDTKQTSEEIKRELNTMWLWRGGWHASRCLLLWRKEYKREERPSAIDLCSRESLGSYGSPDTSIGEGDTDISDTVISSSHARSGLTPRRSRSSELVFSEIVLTKEII